MAKQAPPTKLKEIYSMYLLVLALCACMILTHMPLEHRTISKSTSLSTTAQSLRIEQPGAPQRPEGMQGPTPSSATCDFSNYRTAVCEIKGDVRISRGAVEVVHANGTIQETRIRPYPRKWQKQLLQKVAEVRIEPVEQGRTCTLNHTVPAMIFSTGGYTGSAYHDFNDGLVPIYITSERFHRDVVFVITEFKPWWMKKYGSIVEQLTRFQVLDFNDIGEQVHCFPAVTVGLKIHDELAIDPAKMQDGKSIRDFQQVLRSAYSVQDMQPKKQKPQLVLITRNKTRTLVNKDEVIKRATKVGFEVTALEPAFGTRIGHLFNLLQNADVLVGVHGAGLTHLLFMRPGSVFIQIVPLGTASPSMSFYGKPAMKLGLHYIEHRILPPESTMKNRTAADYAGNAATSIDWMQLKAEYLDSQNVSLSLRRFEPVLRQALARAHSSKNSKYPRQRIQIL